MTIIGDDATTTTVAAVDDAFTRVFHVINDGEGPTIQVTIQNVTIRNGEAFGGAGIYNEFAILEVRNSRLLEKQLYCEPAAPSGTRGLVGRPQRPHR